MSGLFVKYHALAVQPFADVAVMHITPVNAVQTSTVEYEYGINDGLPTLIIYIQKREGSLADKLLYPLRYIFAAFKGYKLITGKTGKPDINHVHILTRSGLIALWKKLAGGTPYIITEHWSRYLPQNKASYSGGLRKWLTKRVVENASMVTTVSKHLGDAMQSHGLENEYRQVSNVVNVDFFTPDHVAPVNSKPVLLHVSCFDEKPKNVKGILDAAHILEGKGVDFELRLVGDGKDHQLCVEYCRQLGLKNVVFTGLRTGDDLLKEFQAADVFILFSRFENQPVVILEAFACELPVIATKVGGIPEVVQNGFGLLIDLEDVNGLVNAVESAIKNPSQFDRAAMRRYVTENYSYQAVGRLFYEIYNSALNK
ncbi:MAG TPA: glycosyltransferase [Bacteroidia bacterium]|nr:glycosyltransferase [Bacteroidia bacterium]